MTEQSWRTEPSVAQLTGTVTYRCATCGELIAEAYVLLVTAEGPRTFHLDHVSSDLPWQGPIAEFDHPPPR